MPSETTSDAATRGDALKRLTTVVLIAGIVIVSTWTIVMVSTRVPDRYVNFGILNANGSAGPFPRTVHPGETLNSSFFLENQLGETRTFQVTVSLASIATTFNLSTGARDAQRLQNYTRTLAPGEQWYSPPVLVQVNQTGTDRALVYEAFVHTPSGYEFLPGKILYFRFNCTS